MYILGTTQTVNKEMLQDAIKATAVHRGSVDQIADTASIMKQVRANQTLINQWEKYRRQFPYAANISYDQVMEVIDGLLKQQ